MHSSSLRTQDSAVVQVPFKMREELPYTNIKLALLQKVDLDESAKMTKK